MGLATRLCSAPFARFCAVGAVGFVVDAAVLSLALRLSGPHPIAARLLSFSVAVLVTFELNRRWAFRGAGARRYRSALLGYLGVQGAGFCCNFGLYAALCLALPRPYGAPLVCLAVASAAALAINYAGARLVVFPSARGRPAAPPGRGDEAAGADTVGTGRLSH